MGEAEDGGICEQGDKIILLNWGVVNVTKVTKEGDRITSIEGAYDADASVKKIKKKFNWVADVGDVVPVKIKEYDNLINKPKLEEHDKIEDCIQEPSYGEMMVIGEPSLRNLDHGTVIQLVRRGFFRCDAPLTSEGPLELILIPDGQAKSMSTLSSALAHR